MYKLVISALVALSLSGCGESKNQAVLGYWLKQDSTNQFVLFEREGDGYAATIFRNKFSNGKFESIEYPAEIESNKITIIQPYEKIIALYRSSDKTLIINGREKYNKIDTVSAKERMSKIIQVQADNEVICLSIQAEVDKKTKENLSKDEWNKFSDSIQVRIPKKCHIMGDGKIW